MFGVDASPLRALVQGAGGALRMKDGGSAPRGLPTPRRTTRHRLGDPRVVVDFVETAGLQPVSHGRSAAGALVAHDTRSSADGSAHAHARPARDDAGVRCSGASVSAAAALQESKAIRYRRGAITILDRGHLEVASCECYSARAPRSIGSTSARFSQPSASSARFRLDGASRRAQAAQPTIVGSHRREHGRVAVETYAEFRAGLFDDRRNSRVVHVTHPREEMMLDLKIQSTEQPGRRGAATRKVDGRLHLGALPAWFPCAPATARAENRRSLRNERAETPFPTPVRAPKRSARRRLRPPRADGIAAVTQMRA